MDVGWESSEEDWVDGSVVVVVVEDEDEEAAASVEVGSTSEDPEGVSGAMDIPCLRMIMDSGSTVTMSPGLKR